MAITPAFRRKPLVGRLGGTVGATLRNTTTVVQPQAVRDISMHSKGNSGEGTAQTAPQGPAKPPKI